ncbi:hypothetical protein KC343_g2306 [Hortaea werneckii]|nr:hypothetical protein KC323_g8443 [Hortaea werneckii]KAI6856877.1 hypothetical protein KC338_g8282 [Hortaea werneckii]KAI7246240.1 hypothetical protein KC352_g14244 [Hortaea werneckii]KAI7345486.1 hypothetical protein KC320_g8300 [Hortaea werneckii]KAI7570278.1 hypothetical protein KC317_g2598 [Hortaea werneckii]
MHGSQLLIALASASGIAALAHPGMHGHGRERRTHGICQQFDVPISASSKNSIFNLTHIDDDVSARSWAIIEDTRTTMQGPERIVEHFNMSGVFNIHAQLCLPFKPTERTADLVQIASHGAHYDSRYWDVQLDPEERSWVNTALREGYGILTYDRLGAGQSDHPDAYRVVQAELELDILRSLTQMTRNGTFHRAMGAKVEAPLRTIHVGHSFGSFLTSAFIARFPELSDAAIITGYIATEFLGSVGTACWSPQYAAKARAGFDGGPGYVLNQKSGIQNLFFAGDPHTAFTEELLDYGDQTKQPVPVGELASSYELVGLPAPEYTGPIHFMLAEFDFFICGGDCKGLTNRTQMGLVYPKSSAIEVDIQPNTGHAFPLHNNASSGFQVSFDFLRRNAM